MARPLLWLVPILAALCICTAYSQHISCEGLFCTLKSDKSYFEVDLYGARLYLLDGAGNPRKEYSSLGLGFSHVIEREKNITDPSRNGSVCLSASGQDPTLNYDLKQDRYFGAIRQIFTISEMVTYLEELPNYPLPDIHTIKFTSYNGPTPILSIIYSLSLIDVNITLSNDTTHTGGLIAESIYRENALKLTLDFPGFPWAAADTGQNWTESFVTIYSNVSYKYTEGDEFYIEHVHGPYARITNELHGYSMAYSLDPFYLIDNVPYKANADSNETQAFPGYLVPPQIFTNLEVCKPTFGHWDNLLYDPSLGVLFSNFPLPDQPESEAAVKGRKSSLLAIYIVVPLVVVALAAVVLVILFVPPVYNAVLTSDPLKRNHLKVPARQADEDIPPKSYSNPTTVPTRAVDSPALPPSSPSSPSAPPASTSWTTVQKPPRA
jgi:hypothetical protein